MMTKTSHKSARRFDTVLRELIRKAEDSGAGAIIPVDYQNDSVVRIDETGVKLKRLVATSIALKLSCAARRHRPECPGPGGGLS
ncbi:MAG: hypothetical protein WBW81_00145 [Methylocella sp.]